MSYASLTKQTQINHTQPARYWIGVVSHNHVQRGVAGGFCQLCHGKAGPLKRMRAGDWLIYYSPKQSMEGNTPCQAFTALGRVVDDEVFEFAMSADFIPWRRRIAYLPVQPAPIRPLIDQLTFIQNKASWGYAFRYGHLEIGQADFDLIRHAMGVSNDAAS